MREPVMRINKRCIICNTDMGLVLPKKKVCSESCANKLYYRTRMINGKQHAYRKKTAEAFRQYYKEYMEKLRKTGKDKQYREKGKHMLRLKRWLNRALHSLRLEEPRRCPICNRQILSRISAESATGSRGKYCSAKCRSRANYLELKTNRPEILRKYRRTNVINNHEYLKAYWRKYSKRKYERLKEVKNHDISGSEAASIRNTGAEGGCQI